MWAEPLPNAMALIMTPISQAGGSRLGQERCSSWVLPPRSSHWPWTAAALFQGLSPPSLLPRPWLLLVAVPHLLPVFGEGPWLSPSLSF